MARMTSTAGRIAARPVSRPQNQVRHSLRQNAIAMFVGQSITWGLTAVTLALLPRYLGPEQMGAMGIGLSFTSIAGTVAGLGMATLVTKDVARDREAAAAMLGTALWLNIIFGVVAGVVGIATGFALGYESMTRLSITAQCATVPLNLLILLGFGALQGVEVMRHQAIWDAANKVFSLAAIGLIIFFDLGFNALLVLSVLSALLCAVPGVVLMHRYVPFDPWSFSFSKARYLVVESIPFCAINIFVIVYLAVDVLLLSVLSGETAVGIYTAPSRIFGTLLFAPTIITTVVFPRMAASFRDAPEGLQQLARGTMRLVVGITLPVAVLAVGTSGPVLVALIGDGFGQSGPVIALLALSLVPTSLNMVAHRILTAADRQRIWTIVMLVGLAAKVALDLALIPLAGHLWGNPALGAALGLVLVETAMMLTGLAYLPRGVFDRPEARLYGRLLASGLVTVLVMVIAGREGFFTAGAAGGLAYVAAVLALRVYTVSGLREAVAWGLGRFPATTSAPFLQKRPAPAAAPLVFEPSRLKGVRAATRR
ncbi:MAG: flippase [Hyphomicrobiales bacterium]